MLLTRLCLHFTPIFHCCLNVILPGQISETGSEYLFKDPYKYPDKVPPEAAIRHLFSSAVEFTPWRPFSLLCKKEVT